MKQHIKDEDIIRELLEDILRYKYYGFQITFILDCFELSRSRYYSFKKRVVNEDFDYTRKKPDKSMLHAITEEEIQAIVKYALANTKYFHRELAYRMLDEDVAFVSPSTCYRILKAHGLIRDYKKKSWYTWEHKSSNRAGQPDELWQTDITFIRYNGRDYYLLVFIDVYSRYVTFAKLLTSMDSQTVTIVFSEYVENNIHLLERIPRLQSDNGSCFVGYEFRSLMSKYDFDHSFISPGCPTENIIVERFNRTVKELLYVEDEPKDFQHLTELIEKVCYYYNYERYHKSLGYVTPHTFYRGNPESIFTEREKKLASAKEKRKLENLRCRN